MARLLAVLLVAMALGGAGAVFVWSTFTAAAAGDADWVRIVLTVPVALAVLALLAWVVRFVRDFEEPKS